MATAIQRRDDNSRNLAIIQALDKKRLEHNYKDGWLYHRAKEHEMLDAFYAYQRGRRADLPLEAFPPAPQLSIELVPEQSWFANVRSHVSRADWDRIRRQIYKNAGYRCQICDERTKLHCHERWYYDDKEKLQILAGFLAICEKCHLVKHFGYANSIGKTAEATNHLQAINGWEEDVADNYTEVQF